MRTTIFSIVLVIFVSGLTACGGNSDSSANGGQAANRAAASASDPNTGITAIGVCNGNPDAGAVGNISGVVDNNDPGTFYGAKSVKSDSGGIHAGYAVVDCAMTIDFGSHVQNADYVNMAGNVKGSWFDNYSQFYFYQGLHAVADVYTLDTAGQKTHVSSQVEEIDPHCIGETVAGSNATQCPFTLSAGSPSNPLGQGVSGVEFDIHFSTITSTNTCFTSCTGTIEPHLTGTSVVNSGVEILSSGS
jgi:hypothetical protein